MDIVVETTQHWFSDSLLTKAAFSTKGAVEVSGKLNTTPISHDLVQSPALWRVFGNSTDGLNIFLKKFNPSVDYCTHIVHNICVPLRGFL